MNINKFTQNSMQAVQNCEKIAYDYGNQELAQEHLLYALITQDDSLILKLLEKMSMHLQATNLTNCFHATTIILLLMKLSVKLACTRE